MVALYFSRRISILLFILYLASGFLIPAGCAAGVDDANLSAKSTLVPDLNVTGVNVSNLSASSRYEITPMRVEVVLSDSPLPAPKGEMAAGPRSIGFFTSPESLAVLLLVVAAVAAGAWYIMKRKPDEDTDEEPEKP